MGIAYCGIDVGLKAHVVCLLDEAQRPVGEYSIANDIEGFAKLASDLNLQTKICLEPTGIHSINIFLYLRNKGHNVRFCKTDSSHNFRQAMFRNKKHDRFDAVALAKYRIVNEDQTLDGLKMIENMGADTYLYSKEHQELAELVEQYHSLRTKAGVLKTRIKSLVDLRFPEAIQVFPGNRGAKAIMKLLLYPKETVLAGEIKVPRLQRIQAKLRQSVGQYDMRQPDFRRCVEELNELEAKITILERSLEEKLHVMGYAYLFGYPCLSTIGVAVLVKDIRDIRRFYRYSKNGNFNKKRSVKAFKKFLGLSVSSNQSGTREGGHRLTKAGNMALRNVLFMMAMNYTHINPDTFKTEYTELNPRTLKALYYQLVDRGTKKIIALTKVMSKIATDLFFILKQRADARPAMVQA